MCIYARLVPDAKNAHMSKVKNDQGVVHVALSYMCTKMVPCILTLA